MPFGGGHLADIAREGIWASLTGGWYYEPAHSPFCNSLHLYIWALLLVLPLLFGLSSNNNYIVDERRFNTGFAVAYLAVVAMLFVLVKLVVSWLHHIFDTVQPIKYKSKKRPTNERLDERRAHGTRFSGSSFSATRATETNPLDMIEMLELTNQARQLRNSRTIDQPDDVQQDAVNVISAHTAGTDVVIQSATEEEEEDGARVELESKSASSTSRTQKRKQAAYLSLPSFDHRNHRRQSKHRLSISEDTREYNENRSPSSSSSTCSSFNSANELLDAAARYQYNQHRRGSWRAAANSGRGLLDTADSLELIPISSSGTGNGHRLRANATATTTLERAQRLSRRLRAHSQQQRKCSEPAATTVAATRNGGGSLGGGSIGRNWRRGRRRSEEKFKERPFVIRRVNSTTETRGRRGKASGSSNVHAANERITGGHRTSVLLSKTGSLGTYFPGGILVDELELNRLGLRSSDKRQQLLALRAQKGADRNEGPVNYRQKVAANKMAKREEPPPDNNIDDEEQQPCCSSSIFAVGNKDSQEQKVEKTEGDDAGRHRRSSSSTSVMATDRQEQQQLPPFSLISSIQGPSTDLAQNTSASLGNNSDDLKGQITKFLEDLIAKHPEAIDAIESVRTNRLFQLGARRQRMDGQSIEGASSTHPFHCEESMLASSNASGQQHHLAVDPTDTSQGAVHTFQDAYGNWFTYWFDSQGTGTAQPLNLAPAVTDMFSRSVDATTEVEQQRQTRHQHRPLTRSLAQPATSFCDEESDSPKMSVPPADELDQEPEHQPQPTVVNVIEARDAEKDRRRKGRHRRQRRQHLRTSSTSSFSSSSSSSTDDARNAKTNNSCSSSDEADSRCIKPINVLNPYGSVNRETRRGGSGGGGPTLPLPLMRVLAAAQQQPPVPPLSRPPPAPARTHGRQLSDSSRHHLLAFMHRLYQQGAADPLSAEFSARTTGQSRTSIAGTRARASISAAMIESLEGVDQQSHGAPQTSASSPVNTVRLLNDLQLARTVPPGLLLYHTARDVLAQRMRLKYCYRLPIPRWLEWWPFGGSAKQQDGDNGGGNGNRKREFKLKLDRLSLAALFDRNSTPWSCMFDVGLALLVGLLATLILSRHIYSELSLLLFAFVVAGAQFSLLKSVQPDSASPVHGFNWQVTYSRPAYFVLLASILLLLDWNSTSVWYNWHPSWLRLYANRSFALSPRDFCANALLFMPVAFTLGLLPQMNTLCMHVLEQLDMHLFGATASLSLGSALFSTVRSTSTLALLVGIIALVQQIFSSSTNVAGSIGFSAFVALTIAAAYTLSRASSNPQFVRLLWEAISRRLKRPKMPMTVTSPSMEETNEQPKKKNSQSTLSGSGVPPTTVPKQLLTCCISTNSNSGAVTVTTVSRRSCEGEGGHRRRKGSHLQQTAKKARQGQESRANGDVAEAEMVREEAEQELLSGSPIHTLVLRAQHDLFSAVLRALILFGIHCTLVFSTGQPYLEKVLAALCIIIGLINHHVYPQLRAKNPWKCFAWPLLRPAEFLQFESTEEAKLCMFERVHAWMLSMEKNIFNPLLIASLMTTSGAIWNNNNFWTLLLMTTCAFRLSRTGFAQPNMLPLPLLATCIIHAGKFGSIEDDPGISSFSTPLFCLFVATIVWAKLVEFLLKVHFILCYIAPWQISWGSAFHAFAQPFSVPHSGLTLAQTLISSILSAPLNPFLGSSFFLMSYIRPVKFWERDYNTKRVDHSKLRLASQLDRGPMIDDSNLNAIFYEHLTRSLQKSLAGDLLLGRWACTVRPGDCFILASNYLNCMVQLVEVGNGFVTFQLRGLEFRGTYCHQREMEAISEDWADNNGACCCCSVGRVPAFISFNNAWALRWLAWEVTVAKYVVDGYSISDNSAVNMLQVHELRRLLVTLFVKSMIFYAIASPQLSVWLTDETVRKALEPIRQNVRFVDPDPVFCAANDEDYDLNLDGLSRQSFAFFYSGWIEHCLLNRRGPALDKQSVQLIHTFCFALSILGRRALGTAAYNRHANAAESFLFGMHALFKGDMRIVHPADEWVFATLDILERVISPAVRMALKLHQDHFAAVVDLEESVELYKRIADYEECIFISHEHDPKWRRAILANTPSLLALRHICDDGQDDYKVIMLNKRHLDMRVIKLNKECVRAFWAGQQQELIFLRNKNPERGSIQNARQVLRNMINSSADQPIGYPIYVSSLTTSFVETHNQLGQVLGPPLTFHFCWRFFRSAFGRLRAHFGTSGSASAPQSIPMANLSAPHPQQQQQQQQQQPVPAHRSDAPPVPAHRSEEIPVAQIMKKFWADNQKHHLDDYEWPQYSASLVPAHQYASFGRTRTKERGDDRQEVAGTSSKGQLDHRHLVAVHRRHQSLSNSLLTGRDDIEREQHQKHNDSNSAKGRRYSAIDATTTTIAVHGSHENAGTDQNQLEMVQIVDPERIFCSLNVPLSSSGDFLVQWPCREWCTRGGAKSWPADWRVRFAGARAPVVHRWTPFHADRAHRSHAGHILLLEISDVNDEGHQRTFYVPILAEGVQKIV